MATVNTSAIAIEKAHREGLEALRELGAPGTADKVEFLDSLGIYLSSTRDEVHLSSAQSTFIAALVRIVVNQDRRISELEGAANAKGSKK